MMILKTVVKLAVGLFSIYDMVIASSYAKKGNVAQTVYYGFLATSGMLICGMGM